MKKMVLFDFDGVIVDTFDLSVEIRRMREPDYTHDEFRNQFDGNIYEYLGNKALTEDDYAHFFEHYSPLLMEREPVSNIKESLLELSETHEMAIVSSSSAAVIDSYLQRYNLRSYFSSILGSETHRSKVEKFNILKKEHGKTCDMVMITDTLGDIVEARKANIDSIAVLWGFHEPERLTRANPWTLVVSPRDLVIAITTYFSKTKQPA